MSEASKDPKTTSIALAPQYDKREYWLVLPTEAFSGEPKILKNPPRTQVNNELVLRLDLLVPKTVRRGNQVIEIKLPEEIGHLTNIEVISRNEPAKT